MSSLSNAHTSLLGPLVTVRQAACQMFRRDDRHQHETLAIVHLSHASMFSARRAHGIGGANKDGGIR